VTHRGPYDPSGDRDDPNAPAHAPAGSDVATGAVRPGDVLAKKYRVERVLGEGGMGVIVAAHHLKLDEKVALKFLLPRAMNNAEAVDRFAREARAAAKIKSEHVARVIDVGELENGAPYIVMEYLEGSDLSAWLKQHGRLQPEQAVGFVLQACEALAEAHVLGIVHRDLKPANLFLAKRPGGAPIVKVLDFGISKATLSTSEARLTQTSSIMGSPLYMSPEQMQSSKTVDIRSDIWALGVVLYELLGGRAPFGGDTMPELVLAVVHSEPTPLRSVCADVPEGLAAVVSCCLAKDPSARFADVGELAAALAPFGPPRSDVSVERIAHVLAAAAERVSPRVVVTHPRGSSVSPAASTAAQGIARTVLTPIEQFEPTRAMPGAATTSKPVSSGQPTSPDARPTRGLGWVLPLAGVVVVLGVAGSLARQQSSRPGAQIDLPSEPSVEPVPPTAAPIAPSAPTVAASASGTASSTSLAPSAPPETTKPPRAAEPSASHPRPPIATPAPTPPPDCNPPYTVDSSGTRHYKRECPN
jgi:eukaryotic-like serine/threonine-protein kinase